MKTFRALRFVWLFAVAATVGCATGAKFTAPKAPRDDIALLYVFRPSNPPFALKPAIIVNGVRVAKLTNKGFFDLELQPGAYLIKAHWPWGSGVPDSEFTLRAERGRAYYVVVESNMHDNMYDSIPTFHSDASIGLAESEFSIKRITLCGEVRKLPGVENLVQPK